MFYCVYWIQEMRSLTWIFCNVWLLWCEWLVNSLLLLGWKQSLCWYHVQSVASSKESLQTSKKTATSLWRCSCENTLPLYSSKLSIMHTHTCAHTHTHTHTYIYIYIYTRARTHTNTCTWCCSFIGFIIYKIENKNVSFFIKILVEERNVMMFRDVQTFMPLLSRLTATSIDQETGKIVCAILTKFRKYDIYQH